MDNENDPRGQRPNSSRGPLVPSKNAAATALNERLIAERVSVLLSHYWTADEPAALREAQLGDWIDDLSRFPASLVADSCKRWRMTDRRKPTPADIVGFCLEAQNDTAHADDARNRYKTTSTAAELREYESERNQKYVEAAEWRRAYLAGEIDGTPHKTFKDILTRAEWAKRQASET
jgi:hypothetical protein